MEFDYNTIKAIAKDAKVSVKDLIALSPGNDPFYVGAPAQMEKAQWGADIYKAMGSLRECHVRRVHYWIVSQDPRVIKPNGEEYLNTIKDWEFLNLALKYARYAELVPIENFIDRRNPPPIVNASFWENEMPSDTKDAIDASELIETIVNKFYCYNPHNTQAYLLEVWCEKSTMNDILEPLCRQYGANLVTGLGELSITAVRLLVEERTYNAEKPVRVFYISDFDPAGESMPLSTSRKIEYFVRSASDQGYDIKLKPIALTEEQCKKYNLPRTPIKPTEKRKDGFEARHGTGATELDALESLYKGELKKIIVNEFSNYFDVSAWNEVNQKNSELRDIVKEFLTENIEDVNKFVTKVLEPLDLSEIDEYEPLIGDEIDDTHENWLYDSNRDYIEQIHHYKDFKRK